MGLVEGGEVACELSALDDLDGVVRGFVSSMEYGRGRNTHLPVELIEMAAASEEGAREPGKRVKCYAVDELEEFKDEVCKNCIEEEL